MPYTAINQLTGETRVFRHLADVLIFLGTRGARGWRID